MGVLAFVAYLSIGMGPGIALYLTIVARRSFLILVTLASAFFWLLSLMFLALIFKAFLPRSPEVGVYAALLITAVFVQEAIRLASWRIYRVSENYVETRTVRGGLGPLSTTDKVSIAFSWGLGHGLVHATLFFLSMITASLRDGTYYIDTCPNMSLFLVAALSTVNFCTLLTFGNVVSFYAASRRSWLLSAVTPCIHLAASLITLLNFRDKGCVASIPVLFGLSSVTVAMAAHGFIVTEKLFTRPEPE
eukprot:jgi/Mesvir1/27092/Mv20777-RA.1